LVDSWEGRDWPAEMREATRRELIYRINAINDSLKIKKNIILGYTLYNLVKFSDLIKD